MDQNLNNKVNPNSFPPGSNVSNKHAELAGQFNNQTPRPPVSNVQQRQEYINPNNFQKVLGTEAQRSPVQTAQNLQNPAQPQITANDLKGNVPQMPVQNFYNTTKQRPAQNVRNTKNNDLIKLVIYAVPFLAVFIHLLKSIDDEDVLWNSRQSLVGQAMWFGVLIILRFIDAPIISNYGPIIANLGFYGLLLFAGIKAYDHQRYNIPVVYDVGRNFIDGKG